MEERKGGINVGMLRGQSRKDTHTEKRILEERENNGRRQGRGRGDIKEKEVEAMEEKGE